MKGMSKNVLRNVGAPLIVVIVTLALSVFSDSKKTNSKISESWLGVYMNGIKVGYTHNRETTAWINGKKFIKSYSESRLKITRLGGNPVEFATTQESLQSMDNRPLETLLKTQMSASETVIKAEIRPEKIVFTLGGEFVKEMPYTEAFYLSLPIEKIIHEKRLYPGSKSVFKLLDPVAYSLSECRFEVLGEEDLLILGQKRRLWHVRSEIASLIPIKIDEWMDTSGQVFKSETQTGFLTSVSIRMSKDKALEVSDQDFDIAFSSLIKANASFSNPQKVRRMTFELTGIPVEKVKQFPWDDGTQVLLNAENGHVAVQTSSVVFNEEDSVVFPVQKDSFELSLKSTVFCQSDDPEVKRMARGIIGKESNAWRAVKRIAEWIDREMTPNYDIGFASAREILRNRQGDCTEYTVLFVALCRAVGIPSRAAVGVMYGDGIFAYHMWPEVYVGRWVNLDPKWLAVDEKSQEYYADATHIKLGRSELDENLFKEMVQSISEIIGRMRITITDYAER